MNLDRLCQSVPALLKIAARACTIKHHVWHRGFRRGRPQL